MNQLTVRGFGDELGESIRRLAQREGISLNQAALKLLRKGAGLPDGRENVNTIGDSLDDLFGTWSPEEAEAFNAALEVFEIVGRIGVGMKILLDSNAYSEFMRGNHRVREIVQAAEEIFMSAVVVGEQLFGFRQGQRFEQNVAELRSFLERPYVTFVPVGPVTADRYSRIMTSLRMKGRPIPTNDVWIAAHAMETGADLVSADRHFGYVDQIVWVRVTPS